jgi:SAM-dependent methyltransferase
MDPNDWDDRYSTEELVWRAEPNRFLVEQVQGMAPGRALDLACGEGRNALWLAEQGWRVTGVDFSGVGLAKARRLAAERGIEAHFVQADVREWRPAAGAYDLVAVMYLHLPAGERRQVMANVSPGLAPGGTLLVVGHDSTNLAHGHGGPQDPAVLFSAADIVADLIAVAGEGSFDVERAEVARRPVSTGDGDGEREALDALVRARRLTCSSL